MTVHTRELSPGDVLVYDEQGYDVVLRLILRMSYDKGNSSYYDMSYMTVRRNNTVTVSHEKRLSGFSLWYPNVYLKWDEV